MESAGSDTTYRPLADILRSAAKSLNSILIDLLLGPNLPKGTTLAKPNYQYEKRQKDLAKKKKQEEKQQEKRRKKLDKNNTPQPEAQDQQP